MALEYRPATMTPPLRRRHAREPTDRPFHIALTDLMDELDIGTNELARRTEYGHATISYLRRPPSDRKWLPASAENIERIADALSRRAREVGREPVKPEHFLEYRRHLLREALNARVDELALTGTYRRALKALRALG